MMRLKTIVAIGFFTLCSCNKGMWVSPYAYRPKKPKFSIQAKRVNVMNKAGTSNLTTAIYLAIKGIQNYNGKYAHTYMGFYPDGTMFTGSVFIEQSNAILPLRNSRNTAQFTGRYATADTTIQIEYFIPPDGGTYIKSHGILKGDTIILVSRVPLLTRREIRYDTLVKTNYAVK